MYKSFCLPLLICTTFNLYAQNQEVIIEKDKMENKINVSIGGKYFTSFIYSDTLEKPFLYPILSAAGQTITRGFPINPRKGDKTDHPHHIGLWLNYESVNGIDFWNNSYAIPKDQKAKYGWIRNVKVTGFKNRKNTGELTYSANWEKQDRTSLLKEESAFLFTGDANTRIIERTTRLTAQKDTVYFRDVKDGLLGLRVGSELEGSSTKPKEFTDNHGTSTSVEASSGTGVYLTSEGKKGNDAWGTRGTWCMLSGKIGGETVSIIIIDHSSNPGYPTYWHARDYGLFAANPLGQKIFSQGKKELNFHLNPGQTVTFKYKIVIGSGLVITPLQVEAFKSSFEKK